MKRSWITALMALALLGLGWWGYNQWKTDTTVSEPATVKLGRGTIERTVLASGIIEAQNLLSVGARVSGQIENLAVSVGQDVKQGDLIAQIDNLDQQNEVLRAKAAQQQIEAQIAAKDASIRAARLVLARAQTLNQKSLTTTEDLEAAQASLDVARGDLGALEAQLEAAKVAVTSAQLALDRTRIVAPIAGTIVAVVTGAGQTVNASSATPTIVKIAQLDQMVVKADISEADVVRVKAGQKATFSLLGEPGISYDAELHGIEPAPASIKDSDTIDTDVAIYYKGLFDVANPERKFRIGMTAEVTILLDRASDVLVLPISTLGKQNADGSYTASVWNSATKQAETRTVTLGLNNNVTAEVTGGLAEGDLVIADRDNGVKAATTTLRAPPGGL